LPDTIFSRREHAYGGGLEVGCKLDIYKNHLFVEGLFGLGIGATSNDASFWAENTFVMLVHLSRFAGSVGWQF
jgi:hypothetical protein